MINSLRVFGINDTFFRVIISLPIALFSLLIITAVLLLATILEIICAIVDFAFCAIFFSEDYLVNKSWLRHFPASVTKTKIIFSVVFRWGFDKENSIFTTIKEEGNFNEVFLIFNSISFAGLSILFLTYMEYWLLVIGLIVLSAFFGPHIVDFLNNILIGLTLKSIPQIKKS